jgi:hypothetical protein
MFFLRLQQSFLDNFGGNANSASDYGRESSLLSRRTITLYIYDCGTYPGPTLVV